MEVYENHPQQGEIDDRNSEVIKFVVNAVSEISVKNLYSIYLNQGKKFL